MIIITKEAEKAFEKQFYSVTEISLMTVLLCLILLWLYTIGPTLCWFYLIKDIRKPMEETYFASVLYI